MRIKNSKCVTCNAADRTAYSTQCRACASERVIAWRQNNKDRTRAACRKYHSRNSERRNKESKSYRDRITVTPKAEPATETQTCKDCSLLKRLEEFPKCKFLSSGRTNECRECQRKRRNAWRDQRRDKERELGRLQYSKDPEKYRANTRAYRAANPDKCRESLRRYAKEHAIEIAEQNKRRYDADPEKYRLRARAWAKANREKANEAKRRRKNLKRSLPGSHTLAQWKTLCEKFKNRCVRCGVSGPLTRDHIVPVTKKGSTDNIDNLQPLCVSCNASKSNRYPADYRKTPFIKQGQLLMF